MDPHQFIEKQFGKYFIALNVKQCDFNRKILISSQFTKCMQHVGYRYYGGYFKGTATLMITMSIPINYLSLHANCIGSMVN